MAGTTATIAGVKAIKAGKQKREGRRALAKLTYPDESVPQEAIENRDRAREQANVGLPSAQYNQAMKNIQRQQSTALAGSQNKRGGLTVLPQILQGTNDATMKLDVTDANARLQNEGRFQNANTVVGNWKNKIWDNNIKQKYIKDYNYAMGLLGMGNANEAKALDQFGQSAVMAGGAVSGGGFGGGGGSSTPNYTPQVTGQTQTDYSGYGSGNNSWG